MKTAQIFAIMVVLLFLAACTQNASNIGVEPSGTNEPEDETEPSENMEDTAVADTTVTIPVEDEEEMKEQEVPEPDYPVRLTAEKEGDNVKLSWTPYEGKFSTYKIMRSTTDIKPVYPGADLVKTISYINETTCTDTKAQVGRNYYAVAVLAGTSKGMMSNVVSVEFPDSREKEGNEITLTAVKTEEGVNLTWNAYDEATGKLMYYKVVRSETNPDPKYPNDNSIEAVPYLDKTSYLDRAARAGKTYYYALTVVRKDQTRYTSEPVIITV